MSSTEQIARLEGLMARIQTNAKKPRIALGRGGVQTDVLAGPMTPASPSDESARAPQVAARSVPQPSAAPVVAAPIAAVAAVAAVEVEYSPIADIAVDVSPEAPPVSLVEGEVEFDTEDFGETIEELDLDDSEIVELSADDEVVSVDAVDAGEVFESEDVEVSLSVPPAQVAAAASELASAALSAAPAAEELVVDAEPIKEPPQSSHRSRPLEFSLTPAPISDAEYSREVPLKTPPPESGQQPSAPVYVSHGPTAEQLGDTLELDEGAPVSLELDDVPVAIAEVAPDQLEFVPPKRDAVGTSIQPPPSEPPHAPTLVHSPQTGLTEPEKEVSRVELRVPTLTAEELATAETAAGVPEAPFAADVAATIVADFRVATVEVQDFEVGADAVVAADEAAAQSVAPLAPPGFDLSPQLVHAPVVAIGVPVVQVLPALRVFRPSTFLELLDASLSLRQ